MGSSTFSAIAKPRRGIMAGTPHSLRNGIIYVLLGGAVLFVAVALGIRVGFALKSDTPPTLIPDNLPNQSLLKPGDVIPELPVLNLDGRATALNDAVDGKPALVPEVRSTAPLFVTSLPVTGVASNPVSRSSSSNKLETSLKSPRPGNFRTGLILSIPLFWPLVEYDKAMFIKKL
jgi:hypothetical protein